jgi:signal transduction histidine kinase
MQIGLHGFSWAAPADATMLGEARRIVTQNGRVISDQLVRLPDALDASWRKESVRIRYEWELETVPGGTPQALWLFRVGAPFRLTFNGQTVTERLPAPPFWANPARPTTKGFNGRTPVLFDLPAGRVTVRVESLGLPYMPVGLVEVRHGPVEALTLLHLQRIEQAALPVDVSKIVSSTLGLIALLLWLVRTNTGVLLFFAGMCGSIAIRDWFYSASRLPVPSTVFEQLNPFLILCFAVSAQAATLLLFEKMTRARKRWLVGIWIGLSGLFVVAELAETGALLMRAMVMLLGNFTLLFIVGQIWRWRAQLPPGRAWILVAGYTMLLLGSLHDLGMATGLVSPEQGTQIPWGFAALVLCYAVITADHVLRHLTLAENAQQLLQQRVAETRRELELSYRQLAQHEQQAAVRQERAHIMRELHDSLGSQLMTAMRGVERDALSKDKLLQALQDSLADLRQLLSTDRTDGRLTVALANWRQHWEDRLDSAGVRTQWALDDSADTVVLTPEHLHHVMRILQETATNTLKHAEASMLRIEAKSEANHLVLQFTDNGCGIGNDKRTERAAASGQGLIGMRSRAAQMGGQLTVEPGPQGLGTFVRLELPLPTHEQPLADCLGDDLSPAG